LTRKSPFPSGGDLPKKYYDVMDPFVVLGAAAAVTKTLLLGTGICLIAQRDPIQTAKQVASIDQVSGGRFLFGIGNGWNEDEMANHGTAFASRHKLARERIEAMKAIWTQSKAEYHGEFVNFDPMMTWPKPVQKPHPPILVGGAFPYGARRALAYGNGWNEDEMANHGTVFTSRHKLARERVEAMKEIWTKSKAEYHGEFVNFDPMMTWPKPVQKPHPPILVGGAFPYGARRALRYGNGWMPHRTRSQYADVQALLPKFREMAAEAGRDPASVPITIWGAKENLDLLKRDRDDGVSRLVVSLDSGKADTILPELDRWATLIRQLDS
jgi:alkanesulfonate monooxygenase SsuD/methylene tetrahydromethanopterin reductase-like flavin-dependent oxidoreductase (luciferase family)